MLKVKLVIRSALIALFVLTLVVAYPVVFVGQGSVLAQSTDPADEEPEPQDPEPAFDFTKLVNGEEANTLETGVLVDVGSSLTFRYEVANTGNVTLTWSTLTDDRLGDLTAECGLPRSVLVGAVETCDVTREAGSFPEGLMNTGTATVIGLNPQQDVAWYRTPPPVDPGPDPMPGFTFTKLVNGQDANDFNSSVLVPVGSTLTFQYQVVNTGNIALQWTNLIDDVYGDLTAECGFLPVMIGVGESATCQITRPAGNYPNGRQNVGTATITNLPPQQDIAWYRTPAVVQPEPELPPVPIPEPITIVLFGTGLAALSAAAAARRRQD